MLAAVSRFGSPPSAVGKGGGKSRQVHPGQCDSLEPCDSEDVGTSLGWVATGCPQKTIDHQVIRRLCGSSELLTHHPLGCSFLAVPGLKQLLGQALEGLGVASGIDGSAHPFHFELLTETQSEGFRHEWMSDGSIQPAQSYKLFQVLSYLLRQGYLVSQGIEADRGPEWVMRSGFIPFRVVPRHNG